MSYGNQLPEGGINSSLIDQDDLLPGMLRWQQFAAIKAIVGRCRACSGELQAVEASEHDAQGEDGEITWYEAKCKSCGKEVAAPNGRTFRRSSAHRETPRGWLEQREKRDGEERRATRAVH
jgi:uncharacterized protein with PIN domain